MPISVSGSYLACRPCPEWSHLVSVGTPDKSHLDRDRVTPNLGYKRLTLDRGYISINQIMIEL